MAIDNDLAAVSRWPKHEPSREYLLDLRDSMNAIASSSSIGHRTRDAARPCSRLNPSNLNVNKAVNASVINYPVSPLLALLLIRAVLRPSFAFSSPALPLFRRFAPLTMFCITHVCAFAKEANKKCKIITVYRRRPRESAGK